LISTDISQWGVNKVFFHFYYLLCRFHNRNNFKSMLSVKTYEIAFVSVFVYLLRCETLCFLQRVFELMCLF